MEYIDLHAHIGASVPPEELWEIAHSQGIKIPKQYDSFLKAYEVGEKMEHSEYVIDKFKLTHRIQSSPAAIERSVFRAIASAYTKSNVTIMELRFNPMLRNMSGHYDLDSIIVSACMGLQKACMTYPVKAGLIIETDRSFDEKKHLILVKKALKYKYLGVVGFDVSGSEQNPNTYDTVKSTVRSMNMAYEGGLGITYHTGEVTSSGEMKYIMENVPVNRIGHGVLATNDQECINMLRDRSVCLEICPTSNVKLGIAKSYDEILNWINIFITNDVEISINTDGNEYMGITCRSEYSLITKAFGIDCTKRILDTAKKYSFVK